MNTPLPQPPTPPIFPAPQPRIGRGTRLTYSPVSGFAYSVAPARFGRNHPFKPALAGNYISFSRGRVDAFEPTISGKPISGGIVGAQPPRLFLDDEVQTAAGESWVCIEVTGITAEGVLDKNSRIEMVHTNVPITFELDKGRQPVALILWAGKRVFAVHEIVHFNLRYARVTVKPNEPPAHHVFR